MSTVNGRVDDPDAWISGTGNDLYREIDRRYDEFDTVLIGRTTYNLGSFMLFGHNWDAGIRELVCVLGWLNVAALENLLPVPGYDGSYIWPRTCEPASARVGAYARFGFACGIDDWRDERIDTERRGARYIQRPRHLAVYGIGERTRLSLGTEPSNGAYSFLFGVWVALGWPHLAGAGRWRGPKDASW
jgi:hypothetical protein